VQVRGSENQEVFVTFSPRFEKKRLPEHVVKEPANIGLRSRYSIRLYPWAKRLAPVGTSSGKILAIIVFLTDIRKRAKILAMPERSEL
jgi:hypothetical protein